MSAKPSDSSVQDSWRPSLGAWQDNEGTHFRVWAPAAQNVDCVFEDVDGTVKNIFPLSAEEDGYFSGSLDRSPPSIFYRYRINGGDRFPDPSSRFQPYGVHGVSQIVPDTFKWRSIPWTGLPSRALVLYELHIGAFTPEGTWDAAAEKLPELKNLGIDAIEMMPVGDFSGQRNWGYDGVYLFAPARCYGSPDDFKTFIQRAHEIGIGVILDVVYNHFGPEGNYSRFYSPFYYGDQQTPWGQSFNIDGERSHDVRDFFIENALYWAHVFRLDGLRLDATHAILDSRQPHLVSEMADEVRRSVAPHRAFHIFIENENPRPAHIDASSTHGWGADGVWADEFHHHLRRFLTGEDEGYFARYSGQLEDLARVIEKGWTAGEPLPAETPLRSCVFCLQNHDQIGNRALGERINQHVDAATYRAASALLLSVPETVLLFMGQEWSASSPFLYFTDFAADLGHAVSKGRRNEFKSFRAFSDPTSIDRIPDPQSFATFKSSQLPWDERTRAPHEKILNLYEDWIQWRQEHSGLPELERASFHARAVSPAGLVLGWETKTHSWLTFVQLKDAGEVHAEALPHRFKKNWKRVLSTESSRYTDDPSEPVIVPGSTPRVSFQRPGVLVLAGS